MYFAVGERHEFRQISVGAETEMQFDSPFGLAELRPGEDGQTEINGCSVEQVELVFELKPMGRGNQSAFLKELEKYSFIQRCWLFLVAPGKSCAGARPDGEMVEFTGLGGNIHD